MSEPFGCPRCERACGPEEGGSDSPLCDACWGIYGDGPLADHWRGYWAGREGWAADGVGEHLQVHAYASGFARGRAKAGLPPPALPPPFP